MATNRSLMDPISLLWSSTLRTLAYMDSNARFRWRSSSVMTAGAAPQAANEVAETAFVTGIPRAAPRCAA